MQLAAFTTRLGLPLLARELIEQAARRRTYILRTVYAVLLFAASFILFYETVRFSNSSPLAALGRGRQMFAALVGVQFAGVYLFMPAISCSVLTQEKEKNSLQLLFLTRLGPWTIVLEKLASRLVPMACYLLLSLPLLAYCYSLGGISAGALWSAVWMLGVTTLQMGSVAVLCSAWFRTTAAAFMGTYLLAAAILLGPFLAGQLLTGGRVFSGTRLTGMLILGGLYESPWEVWFPFCAPMQFLEKLEWGNVELGTTLLRSVPIVVQSAACVVLARACLVRRSALPARNALLAVFQWLDRQFLRLNENRLTRGVVLIGERDRLPDDEPVAWRETIKRSLGRARYLIRIFLVFEVPLIVACLLIAAGGHDHGEAASAIMFVLWVVSLLILSVQSSSLIAGERSHQTLDVLATTPLTGEDILRQKFRSVRRVMLVLATPLLTLTMFEGWWRWFLGSKVWYYGGREDFEPLLYLTCSVLAVVVYLPLAAWLSFLVGLALKSQARAIIAALGALVGWCILPLVFIVAPLVIMFDIPPPSTNTPTGYLLLVSPMIIIPFNEFAELEEFGGLPWLAVAINFLAYGSMLLIFRRACLRNADRFLGRAEAA